jgi:hypothetical protein
MQTKQPDRTTRSRGTRRTGPKKGRRGGYRRASREAGAFVRSWAEGALHAKQLQAMVTTLRGTLEAGRLSLTAIGRALGEIAGEDAKHHIKQVDRFVGNAKLDDAELQRRWSRHVLGGMKRVVLAIDWTDFDDDNQSVITIHAIGEKGRSTPLVWETADKRRLKANRNRLESLVIKRLHEALPDEIEVILLADRGFGDVERYAELDNLGWFYVIRFRGVIRMSVEDGELRPAASYVPDSGRAKLFRNVKLTKRRVEAAGVVAVKEKGMKDAWLLATKLPPEMMKAATAKNLYGKRFRIEETFRDLKDPRYGVGFSTVQVSTLARRNRFLLLQAMAHTLLELLGQAGENLGMDRGLYASTAKKRQLSLFRQGQFWLRAIWNRPVEDEERMLSEFGRLVHENTFFRQVFEVMK